MSLSLRSRLAIGFAIVGVIPVAVMEQAASRLVRGEFVSRTEAQFKESRRLVEIHFRREGESVTARVRGVLESVEFREALLGYVAALKGRSRGGRSLGVAQSDLGDAVEDAAGRLGLDLLAVHRADGTIIASAQERMRFDEMDERVLRQLRELPGRAALDREAGVAVRGLALRVVIPTDDLPDGYWLAGGLLVDAAFLRSLPLSDSLAFLVVERDGVMSAPTASGAEALQLLGERALPAGDVLARLEAADWQAAAIVLQEIESLEPVDLILATSLAPLQAYLEKQQVLFAGLLFAGLAIAFVFAYFFSRYWTEPVRRLAHGFDRVSQGDLSYRVGGEADDELGRLGRAFDRMSADLSESRDKLVQVERLAAWQDIARRLAHEIKNPLSPIALSMETLRRSHEAGRPEFPEILAESTQTVLEEVERLRKIIQEFSDFARLPSPKLVEEDFHEVIRGVLSLLAPGSSGKHRFVTDFKAGEGVFFFDPDQMNRLLINLIQNAIEAMPEGGEIQIETRIDRAIGRFTLLISDTGPGVPEEAQEELFLPYRTSKPGGTGLGLAIVYRIASEHHGTIALVPGATSGATFRLELPLVAEDDDGS